MRNKTNQKITHYCKINKTNSKGLNFEILENNNMPPLITGNSPRWGNAITYCYGINNKLYVSNGEYENEVNYCPSCGFSFK